MKYKAFILLKEKQSCARMYNMNPVAILSKNKKFCILIFLKNVQRIKPFEIDKTGSA